MSFSSAARRSLSAAGSKVVREQRQLVTERRDVDVGRVEGHASEASGLPSVAVPNLNNSEFDNLRALRFHAGDAHPCFDGVERSDA
jgi:hypothetical protein